jgi:hypothetical protein
MKRILMTTLFLGAIIAGSFQVQAQGKYFTKTGKITFYSKAPMEDIEAKNKTVAAILDTKTGALQFSVLMKGFEFEKALMQEHFNENYVESDKFPKAEFKGTIVGTPDLALNGSHNVTVKGKLTMHGVTRDVETSGIVKVEDGKLLTSASFTALLSDYNIAIPSLVKDKISNKITVNVDCRLEPLK